jgi:hypothetical protein
MAGPILLHSDFFDFEGYKRGIKDIDAATKEFGSSVDQTLKNIAANQREWLNTLKDVASVMKSFNVNTTGAKDVLAKYNEEIETARQENERLAAAGTTLKTSIDTTKASVAELKAEYSRLRKEAENLKPGQADFAEKTREINTQIKAVLPNIKSFETEVRNTKKYVDVVNDSYGQMQQRLTALKNELKNMANAFDPVTGKLNKNNAEAIRLSNEIGVLDKSLKTADATMGMFGRNVGNYASGFSPMQNAINQITREAPSAAAGMRVFFLAISNNLPALFDAVSGAKNLNKELLASGEKVTPVWKQLIGSFFSWQTLLSAGITILTVYGAKIVDWVASLFTGAKAMDEMAVKMKLFNEVNSEANKHASEDITKLKVLYTAATDVNLAMKDRLLAVNALQREFPEYFKNIKDEAILNGKAKDSYDLLYTSIIKTARAAAVQGKLAKLEAEKLDVEVQKQKIENATTQEKAAVKPISGKNFAGEKVVSQESIRAKLAYDIQTIEDRRLKALDAEEKKLKDINKQQEMLRGFVDEASQVRAAGGDPIKDAEDAKKAGKDAEDALKKLRDAISKQQALLKSAAELEIKENELRVARGLMTEFEFQGKKLDIMRAYAKKASDLERTLGAHQDPKRIADFQKEREAAEVEFTKYMNDQQRLRRDLAIKSVDDVVKAEAAAKKKQSDLDDAFNKKFEDGQKQRLDKTLERLRREYELEEAARGKNFSREIKYLNDIIQAKKRAGEDYSKDQERINVMMADREHQIQLQLNQLLADSVAAGLSILKDSVDSHFQDRISKLEEEKTYELNLAGTNAAARAAIERDFQKRIAKEKEKQAKADKAFALFNVALNTAVAIQKTIAEWGMPLAIPFIAIAAAQGLVQAAVIAARPIPHYEKGTKSAKAGPAVINEKGWEIIERNGRMFLEGNAGPSLVNLKGGEKIHTHQESVKIIERAIASGDSKDEMSSIAASGRMAAGIRQGKNAEQIQMLSRAMQAGGMNEAAMKRVMDGTLAKMPIERNIWDERGYRKQQQRLNERTTYINNRFKN